MTPRPEAVCDCSGPPWPAMKRLSVGGWNRYFLCTDCATIREEVCRRDGTIAQVRYHAKDSAALSQVVREQAGEILKLLSYEQKGLFEDKTQP